MRVGSLVTIDARLRDDRAGGAAPEQIAADVAAAIWKPTAEDRAEVDTVIAG